MRTRFTPVATTPSSIWNTWWMCECTLPSDSSPNMCTVLPARAAEPTTLSQFAVLKNAPLSRLSSTSFVPWL